MVWWMESSRLESLHTFCNGSVGVLTYHFMLTMMMNDDDAVDDSLIDMHPPCWEIELQRAVNDLIFAIIF